MRIEINQLPPVEYSPNWRGHWSERYRAGVSYGHAVFYSCIDARNRQHIVRFKYAKVDLTFVFTKERTRDADNLIARFKPGLDAIARTGLIKDDDIKHLKIGDVKIEVDANRAPMTIIEIEEETNG